MKNSVFLLLLFITISAVYGQTVMEINHAIYAANEKQIEPEFIGYGNIPVLSNNGEYAAYIFPFYNKHYTGDDSGIYLKIYNLETMETVTYEKPRDLFAAMELFWSPDDRYIMGDCGTYTIRGITVIDALTGETVTQDSLIGSSFIWVENDILLVSGVTGSGRKGGMDEYTFGTYMLTFSEDEVDKTILYQSDEYNDYTIIKKQSSKDNVVIEHKKLRDLTPEELKEKPERAMYPYEVVEKKFIILNPENWNNP